MTDRYYDYVGGSDSNDGLTSSTPKKTYTSVGVNNGDTFYFKRGVENIVTVNFTQLRSGIDDNNRSKYLPYGEAQVPYAIWRYGNTGNMILNASFTKFATMEDMYFDMSDIGSGSPDISMYCASQGSSNTYNVTVRRCLFSGGKGSGLLLNREGTSTVIPYNYVFEDCNFFDNKSHGLLVKGVTDVVVDGCNFYRNGTSTLVGGHGFSAGVLYTTTTNGWAQVPATTIWYRTLAAAELDVFYVITNISPYYKLYRNIITPTTPGVGEYGAVGGVLYINAGTSTAPTNAGSITYVWGNCSRILVKNCEAWDNVWDQRAAYHEGHGFAFDDWTDSSTFQNNISRDNQGMGFSINKGFNNTIIGNEAYNNWQCAVNCTYGDNLRVLNNSFRANNIGTTVYDAEININNFVLNAEVSGNIIKKDRGLSKYGVNIATSNTTGSGGVGNKMHGFDVFDANGQLVDTQGLLR